MQYLIGTIDALSDPDCGIALMRLGEFASHAPDEVRHVLEAALAECMYPQMGVSIELAGSVVDHKVATQEAIDLLRAECAHIRLDPDLSALYAGNTPYEILAWALSRELGCALEEVRRYESAFVDSIDDLLD